MGRQAIVNLSLTLTAITAWSVHHLIGFDGSQASVKGQKVLGSARADAAIGDEQAVDVDDTVLVVAGAAVAVGDSLISDVNAQAIPDDGVAGNYIWADALEAASAAGQVIEVIPRR